ncbi:MAG: CpcT/CpeT family chromophore lyase [Xenococcaceae cyanobacterium]
MKRIWQLGAIVALYLPTPVLAMPQSSHVRAVVNHLLGTMDTAIQAATEDKADVQMTTCRVKNDNSPSFVYLYQEQSLRESLDSPYRQRFLQIKAGAEKDTVISQSYKPIEPKKWIGLCDRPETERVVNSRDMSQPICSVLLKPQIGIYVGKTPPEGCPLRSCTSSDKNQNQVHLTRV